MKKFLKSFMVVALMLFCSIGLVACGEKQNYDLSNITFENKTVTYSGSTQTMSISGTLPEGVAVNYEYYEGETKLSGAPTDAGTYTVVAKFSGDTNNYNAIEDKTATLTINKADIELSIGASKKAYGNTTVNLSTRKLFSKQEDDSYAFNFDGNFYYADIMKSDVQIKSKKFYTALNDDGSIDETSETEDNCMKLVDQVLYIQVQFENNRNYNVEDRVITVRLTNANSLSLVPISTPEDLEKIREDFDKPALERQNTIYYLTNDINLNDAIWKTLAPYYNDKPENSETDFDKYFVSEFNGNGFKIYGFKLTDESIAEDVAGHHDSTDKMLGFFGSVTDAYIHDVTFSDYTVDVTTENNLFYGIVARVEDSLSKFGRPVRLENITTENATINLKTPKGYVGIFVGGDNTSDGLRKNLKANNIKITAITTGRCSLGGIIGELGTRGTGTTYENCTLSDIELQIGSDESNVSEAFLGAFVGNHRNAGIFKDCSIENYKLKAYANTTNCNGYYGNLESNEIAFDGCTHTAPKTDSDEVVWDERTTAVD